RRPAAHVQPQRREPGDQTEQTGHQRQRRQRPVAVRPGRAAPGVPGRRRVRAFPGFRAVRGIRGRVIGRLGAVAGTVRVVDHVGRRLFQVVPLLQSGRDLDPGVLALLTLLDGGQVQHLRRLLGDPEGQPELLEVAVRQGPAGPGDLGDRRRRRVVALVRAVALGRFAVPGHQFHLPAGHHLGADALDTLGYADAYRNGRRAIAAVTHPQAGPE